jgi:hypothetical protein
MPRDPKVIPIMRGRLVLVAERYGTPREFCSLQAALDAERDAYEETVGYFVAKDNAAAAQMIAEGDSILLKPGLNSDGP